MADDDLVYDVNEHRRDQDFDDSEFDHGANVQSFRADRQEERIF